MSAYLKANKKKEMINFYLSHSYYHFN